MKIMHSESEQKLQRQKKSELKAEWKKLKLVIRYSANVFSLRLFAPCGLSVLFLSIVWLIVAISDLIVG